MIDQKTKEMIEHSVYEAIKECKILYEKIKYEVDDPLKMFLRTLARIKVVELAVLQAAGEVSGQPEVIGEIAKALSLCFIIEQTDVWHYDKKGLAPLICPFFDQDQKQNSPNSCQKVFSGQKVDRVVLYEKALETLTKSLAKRKSR